MRLFFSGESQDVELADEKSCEIIGFICVGFETMESLGRFDFAINEGREFGNYI